MIRFTPDLNAEINRVVSKFNSKINRLTKQNAVRLPSLVDESVLKAKYVDRRLLLRELKQLEDFTKPGAEEIMTTASGIKMSKWELNKLEQDRIYSLRAVNKALKSGVIGDKAKTLSSQQHFLKNQKMRSMLAKRARDRNEDESYIRSLRSISGTIINRKARNYLYKQNLLDMITNGFSQAGMDQETVERIKSKLEQLSPDQLAEAYHDNTEIRNFIEGYHALRNAEYTFTQQSDGKIDVVDNLDNMANISKEFEQKIDTIVDEITSGEDTANTIKNTKSQYEY